MVEHDGQVGQLCKKLDDLGIADNTIVIYTTDNGAETFTWPDGGTTPFRGEKNTNWEGGYRVPALVRWPGLVQPRTEINDIVSAEDWVPTLVAAAGEPDIKNKLLQGYDAGGKTFKVHLDGYDQRDLLAGKGPDKRREFFYWTDDGNLAGLRYDQWKVVFMEQRSHGFDVWQEPLVPLRAPKIFNLRSDPFERADHEAGEYDKWFIEHAFVFVPAQAIVGQHLRTFQEFPPRQKPGSFSVEQASAARPAPAATRPRHSFGAVRSTSSRWPMRPTSRCWAISTMRSFDYYGVHSRFFRKDGKFFVETDGPDGKLAVFEVKYTFGLDPLQQYLVEFPDGRLQALSIAWDSRPKDKGGQRWFHLYPNEEIKHDDILHWTKLNQNWNFMCAECHSTGVRKNYDATNDRFATTWAEISVGCEACHGQGSRHVGWARDRQSWWPFGKIDDPTMGLLGRFTERRDATWALNAATGNMIRSTAPRALRAEVETCGLCHARRAQFSEAWVPGRSLSETHMVSPLSRGLYHADGQMLDEVYNYGSFKQSKMFAAGVTCSDCHDPHSAKLRVFPATASACNVTRPTNTRQSRTTVTRL